MFNQAAAKKQSEVRRIRAKLVKNLDKLERDRLYYLEKAKAAKLRGENESYRLARSGLSATLTQLQRVREMLLNIDITTQMRDMSGTTQIFLGSMDDIFKSLRKLNRKTDIKGTQASLRRAMAGMESMQENLDELLMQTEQSFGDISQMDAVVSEKELDQLIGRELNLDVELTGEDVIKEAKTTAQKTAEPLKQTANGVKKPTVFRIPGTEPTADKPPFEPDLPAAEPELPLPIKDAPEVSPESKLSGQVEFDFSRYEYIKPPLSLLNSFHKDSIPPEVYEEAEAAALEVEKTLREMGVPATAVNTVVGPQFVRLELSLPPGVSVAKVTPYVNDLSMRLKTDVRLEAPIRGKNAFGVEFANPRRTVVTLHEMLGGIQDGQVPNKGLQYCLGADIERKPVFFDLSAAPHMMIAGATGSGKSCFLHAFLLSLMYRYSPDELKLLVVDFKRVEMAAYNGSPFMLTERVVDNERDALDAFRALVELMETRYELMTTRRVRNLAEHNAAVPETLRMPYIVAVVDEFADIPGGREAKEYDRLIRSLSQKARAAGIHLVFATQRPSTDVISGTTRSNFPIQVAFRLSRDTDSRVALAGETGAEKLIGNGDLLYNDPVKGLCRYQAPLVTQDEITRVTEFIIDNTRRVF